MNRIAITLTLATGALSLAACGPKAEPLPASDNVTADNVSAPQAPAATLTPGQTFANTAAASDAFEIATSNLALQKSQSTAIKRFAQHMVTAHDESTAKLNTAAASASPAITPNPALTSAQQSKLTELQAKQGAEFDTAYAAEQVAAHQATLDALRAYAASADVPQLGAFATEMVPTVAAHLNTAKTLKP